VSGSNVWAWGGEGFSKNPDFWWRPGDPYVGDPPQEPQGRNSIFISDSSTIAILRQYGRKMTMIGLDSSMVRLP
jgi:mannan endo-1,4-beta-mannosidase